VAQARVFAEQGRDGMDNDKRKGEKPVPENVESMLNEMQLLALRQIEGFGWRIKFVRRPLFQDVVVVVMSGEGDKIGVLEEDGRVNMQPDIQVRD
jgi:hypothetical protein